jgi:proline-specific peptidase
MTRAMEQGFVNVTGGRVWYGVEGATSPGVPLLTIHGGPGATHDYLEPLARLADERPVVFYDQLGSGSSDRPNDPGLWSVDRFVEELALLRAALGLETVHLLGSSWGTMLAVEYLLRTGSAGVKGLVLSAPYLSTARWVADQRTYVAAMPPEIRDAIERGEMARDYSSAEYQTAMTAFYRRHLCRLDPWPECLERTFARMSQDVYEHLWGPSEFTMTGTLRDADLTGRLGHIAVPTLFTCGRHDEATPATTAYYRGLMPNAQLAVVEDASHSHHLEQPDTYLALVRGFLRRADTAPEGST